MKKQLQVYIEDSTQGLLDSLQSKMKNFANLKRVEIKLNQFIQPRQDKQNYDGLSVYILSSSPAFNYFNKNVLEDQELYAMCEINSSIRPAFDLLKNKQWDKNILDFAMIGGQRQYFANEDYNYLNDKYYDFLHLGDVRKEISEIEPYLRDSHILRMSFNALRYADFSSKKDYNPSGFHAEDFIAFARYAGLSPKLNHIAFPDIDLRKLEDDATGQELIAQILWYMAEGYGFREKEKHENEENEHYVFDIDDPELQIEFIQSPKSGRWWYSFIDSMGVRHTFSCNFTDFESMQNKIVSPRIKSAILRYL